MKNLLRSPTEAFTVVKTKQSTKINPNEGLRVHILYNVRLLRHLVLFLFTSRPLAACPSSTCHRNLTDLTICSLFVPLIFWKSLSSLSTYHCKGTPPKCDSCYFFDTPLENVNASQSNVKWNEWNIKFCELRFRLHCVLAGCLLN